ncbi:hypothetical protein GQX74_004595 [Glossina fuscipes]|nr:hypothetical protein GQX74_004595 [Glossina fuscipes]
MAAAPGVNLNVILTGAASRSLTGTGRVTIGSIFFIISGSNSINMECVVPPAPLLAGLTFVVPLVIDSMSIICDCCCCCCCCCCCGCCKDESKLRPFCLDCGKGAPSSIMPWVLCL